MNIKKWEAVTMAAFFVPYGSQIVSVSINGILMNKNGSESRQDGF